MDWHYLGHASWLAVVGDLRILFDPLLDDVHGGGVFEVFPPRALDAEALRPDFVIVSHRHPDHFDPASLARLAALDDETVLLTSDELVERAARRLGFRTVARAAAWDRVELDGATLIPTPSSASEPEWGVAVRSAEGLAWNQVDTAPRPGELAMGLGRRIDLALARWQPLREIEAVTAGEIGFPLAAHRALLDAVAELAPGALVPASAGTRHRGAHAWMNRLVYPLGEERFLADVAARAPAIRTFPARVGGTYRLRGGQVELDPAGARSFCAPRPAADDRLFAPLAIPELRDEDPNEADLRRTIDPWLDEVLAPALREAAMDRAVLALSVVYRSGSDDRTFVVGEGTKPGIDPDYDVLNAVAGADLAAVIAGRRHWGEPLLAGRLRSSSRAYRVDHAGVRAAAIAPIFLYYALPYDRAFERWLDRELELLVG